MNKLKIGDKVKLLTRSYSPKVPEWGTNRQLPITPDHSIEIESVFTEKQQKATRSGLKPTTVEKAICKMSDETNNVQYFVYLTKYLTLDKRESL